MITEEEMQKNEDAYLEFARKCELELLERQKRLLKIIGIDIPITYEEVMKSFEKK